MGEAEEKMRRLLLSYLGQVEAQNMLRDIFEIKNRNAQQGEGLMRELRVMLVQTCELVNGPRYAVLDAAERKEEDRKIILNFCALRKKVQEERKAPYAIHTGLQETSAP